jgi:hypothetical protein
LHENRALYQGTTFSRALIQNRAFLKPATSALKAKSSSHAGSLAGKTNRPNKTALTFA